MAYELVYGSNTLPENITQQLINYAENELNVPPSYLITKLHYEGLWGGSAVARSNNNWGGMTWAGWDSPHTRESGVTVTRGSPRPAIEGGYYIRYASVQDFLIDWSYLIRRGGIYNVADSDTFNEAVKGMFIVGGATYDYATMNVEGSQRRYELYLEGMLARRNAINTANDGKLDLLDNESHATDDSFPEPDPNEPDPFPDGEGDGGGTGIDLVSFINDLNELIKKMLSSDIFHMGSSDYYKNDYVRLMKQMKNSYKIQPNENFFKAIEEKFNDFNAGYIPEPDEPTDPEEPDPNPNPTTKVFPVRLGNGINFWKRNNWGYGTLQRNMTYGPRPDGTNHYAYDIGGGGNVHHTIYSVTNGKVLEAFYENYTGYHIVIQNEDDEYFIQYAHLDSFLVNVGDTVQAGDPIARMGNTGWDNMAIHLDIGIAKDKDNFYSFENTIDPEIYLEVDKDNSTKLPLP